MKNLLIIPAVAFLLFATYVTAGPDRHQTLHLPFYVDVCDVIVQGDMVVHVLEDTDVKKDGRIFYRYHFNLHGTGVDNAGNEYVYNHVWNTNIKMNGLPYVHNFVRSLRLISIGPDANIHTNCFLKITVNANGETKVEIVAINTDNCD